MKPSTYIGLSIAGLWVALGLIIGQPVTSRVPAESTNALYFRFTGTNLVVSDNLRSITLGAIDTNAIVAAVIARMSAGVWTVTGTQLVNGQLKISIPIP